MRSEGLSSGLTLGLVFLFAATARGAPAGPGEAGVALLPELVVTATRYSEEAATVPANVSVITAEDIANSNATDVPGVLQEEVGLHVYDITGNGRSYRVDRSGFGETAALNTLVLVDGRRLNNPDLAGADWLLIPLERVRRIEVIRGSRGSVLYGDNATDSVINIMTKVGEEGLRFGAEAAGGSFGTQRPSAYVRGTYGDLSYAVSGAHFKTDGYRENADSRRGDLGLNLDYFFGDRARVTLESGYHEDDTGLPGALRLSALAAGADRRDSTHPMDFADTRDRYVQLSPEVYFLDNSYFKAPLSYRKREQDFFSSFLGGEFRGDTVIAYASGSPQVVVREPIGGLDNSLTVGFDYHAADEDITNRTRFFGDLDVGRFDLEKRNTGLYVHDEIYPVEGLAISAGYRWDRVDYAFAPTAAATPDGADYRQGLFTAGINYRYRADSHLYLSYSDGFRYPVLDELFSFFTNTVNVELRPQSSDNYEIGLRHRFTDGLHVTLNFFRLDTHDEIFFNPAVFANDNLDSETRREGVELSAGYASKALSVGGAYSYRDTEIRGGDWSGHQVPNVPAHQASLEVLWRPVERLTLALSGIYVGERYLESDYANAFQKQDDYKVVNLKVKYSGQNYTASLDLNNVFGEKYAAYGVLSTFPSEPAFYPSPEFNLFAGLRFDY